MKTKILNFSSVFLIVVLFVGCASAYKPVKPMSVYYSNNNINDGISYTYQYDVLQNRKNKKYVKRQRTSDIKVVAVKITNNTNFPINVGEDLRLRCGGKEIVPMEPTVVKSELKQRTLSYLFYLLLTPLKGYVQTPGSISTYNIGYVLGPGITAGNMIVAGSANDNFEKELMNENLVAKNIEPGKTVYGLLSFRNIAYDPITIEVRDMEKLAEKTRE